MSGSGGGHWEQDQHKLAPRPMAYLTQDPRETPGRQIRPDPPLPRPARTIAGVRSPRMARKPMTWTPVDRETLRVDLQTLFTHLGITPIQAAAA